MKSSPKVISAAQFAKKAAAWQPPELTAQLSAPDEFDLESILAVFRVEAQRLTADGDAPVRKQTMIWQPEEFTAEAAAVKDPPVFVDLQKSDEGEAWAGFNRGGYGDTDDQAILEEARAQAAAIIQQAQQTADELIAEAEDDIVAQRQQAVEQGLAEGRAAMQSSISAAHTLVQQVAEWKEEVLLQAGPMIIEMVKDIALKMFGEGVELSDKALQQNLNRVLTNAKSLGDLNIFLNPHDAIVLDSGWREMRATITGSRIQVIPSETIKPGGCYAQGQMGAVDARVEVQLQAMLDTLSAARGDEELLQ